MTEIGINKQLFPVIEVKIGINNFVYTFAQSGSEPAGMMQFGSQFNQLYVNRKRTSFWNIAFVNRH